MEENSDLFRRCFCTVVCGQSLEPLKNQATLALAQRFEHDSNVKLGASWTGLHIKPWGFRNDYGDPRNDHVSLRMTL